MQRNNIIRQSIIRDSLVTGKYHVEFEGLFLVSNFHTLFNESSKNNFQTNNYSIVRRVSTTIYHNSNNDDYGNRSFSSIKFCAHTKICLSDDQYYRWKVAH